MLCSNQLSYVAKFYCFTSYNDWLGYLDSNQGMPVSKTGALPLGDTPTTAASYAKVEEIWLGYLDSNQGMPVSKTGALPLGDTPSVQRNYEVVREARLELAHLAAPEPKSGASTNFATPAKKMVATTGIEPVTPSL